MYLKRIKIKPEFSSFVVGFNGKALPLSERSEEDLRDLAIMARKGGTSLKRFFEVLPTLQELNDYKIGEAFKEYEQKQQQAESKSKQSNPQKGNRKKK